METAGGAHSLKGVIESFPNATTCFRVTEFIMGGKLKAREDFYVKIN